MAFLLINTMTIPHWIYGLDFGPDGAIYVGSGLGIYRIEESGTVEVWSTTSGLQFSGLAWSPNGSVMYAVRSNAASPAPQSRIYEVTESGYTEWSDPVGDFVNVTSLSSPTHNEAWVSGAGGPYLWHFVNGGAPVDIFNWPDYSLSGHAWINGAIYISAFDYENNQARIFHTSGEVVHVWESGFFPRAICEYKGRLIAVGSAPGAHQIRSLFLDTGIERLEGEIPVDPDHSMQFEEIKAKDDLLAITSWRPDSGNFIGTVWLGELTEPDGGITPVQSSFIQKFQSQTSLLSLAAGSKTQDGDLDGPALDARFTSTKEINMVADRVQRKLINEGWNRYYFLDNGKIKLLHPCEDDLIFPRQYSIQAHEWYNLGNDGWPMLILDKDNQTTEDGIHMVEGTAWDAAVFVQAGITISEITAIFDFFDPIEGTTTVHVGVYADVDFDYWPNRRNPWNVPWTLIAEAFAPGSGTNATVTLPGPVVSQGYHIVAWVGTDQDYLYHTSNSMLSFNFS